MNKKVKKTVLATSLVAIVAISAIAIAFAQNRMPEMDAPLKEARGHDLTVTVEGLNQQDLNDKIVTQAEISTSKISINNGEPQTLYQDADVVVYAQIQNLTYYAFHGNACTKFDVTILDSLKGNLNKGDQISVVQMGGYIPLRLEGGFLSHPERFDMTENEIDKTVVCERVDGEPLPEIGQIGVFFLMAKNDYNNIPDGSYCRLSEFESAYIENESGILERYAPVENYYSQLQPNAPQTRSAAPDLLQNGERPYTYEQMKELLLAQ